MKDGIECEERGDDALARMTKALVADIKADHESHMFTAAISTNTVDRDGEVLIPQGMDATEFAKNPIVFYNHNYDRPIAKQVGKFKREDSRIVASAEFAKRPKGFRGTWFPDEIRGLVQADVVKGVSVGFQGQAGGMRNATKADHEKYGPEVQRVFSNWKLLEWSVAPLQSNPDALIHASHKGIITPERCKELFGVVVPKRRTQVLVVAPGQPKERRRVYTIVRTVPARRRVAKVVASEPVPKAEVRASIKKRLGKLYG